MVNAWSLLFDVLNMTKHSKHYYEYDRNDPNRKAPKVDGYSVEGKSNQDFWEDDGISMTGYPGPFAADTICLGGAAGTDSIDFGVAEEPYSPSLIFGGSHLSGGEDHISFTGTKLGNPNFRKYNEDKIIKELSDYISATYSSHYSAGSDKIQTLDLIEACGDGESFCRSNILKYASRYDKKGTARRDIMKILHYAVLLMFFNDKNNKTETYNQ